MCPRCDNPYDQGDICRRCFDPIEVGSVPEKAVDIAVSTRPILSLSWSPVGNTLAYGTEDGEVGIIDLDHRQIALRCPHMHRSPVLSVSSDGRRVASGSAYQTIKIWSASSGHVEKTYGARDRVVGVAWHEELLIAASRDEPPKLWDGDTARAGTLMQIDTMTDHCTTWIAHSDSISQVRVSGAWVLTAGRDGLARVWEGETLLLELQHPRVVHSIEQLMDVRYVTADDGALHWWGRDGTPQGSMTGLGGRPLTLERAGHELLVALRNGGLCRVDPERRRVTQQLRFPSRTLCMAQRDATLALGTCDGHIWILELS